MSPLLYIHNTEIFQKRIVMHIVIYYTEHPLCRGGGIGRRAGFKIR